MSDQVREKPVRYPSRTLRVVIADYGAFFGAQEPVSHRTVAIELTDEQLEKLKLRHTHTKGMDTPQYESVSMVFFEPSGSEHWGQV